MSFEDMMNKFGDDFDNAQASDFSEEVPDGHYLVHITKAFINQSKSSGRWQVSWDFTVLWDPAMKYKNRHIFSHQGLTTVDKKTGEHTPNKVGMGILKSDLRKIGFANITKETLPNAIEQCVGKIVLVSVKTKGEFTNVTFDGKYADSLEGFVQPSSLMDVRNKLEEVAMGATPVVRSTISSANVPPLQFDE